jgi:hypothetical protein
MLILAIEPQLAVVTGFEDRRRGCQVVVNKLKFK